MDAQNNNAPMQKNDTQNMAILAYIGPLVIIPYLTSKNDPFVKFHVKQGLVLLCLEVLIWVLTPMFFGAFWSLLRLVNLLTLVLAIIGVVNVLHKKEAMLPVIGSLSSYFNF